MVHETFSIPLLERKMMFLNEPSLQNTNPHQAADQIRLAWRVHYQQMQNMKKGSKDGGQEDETDDGNQDKVTFGDDAVVAKNPGSIDEIGGQLGFSAPSQRPKDYNSFQNAVRNQLNELSRAHKDLRARFKQAGTEVDKDIQRIETLTEHIQKVFNDFILCFNSFVQREERLETLHHQAIKKSKELSKKIQLEVMAQSSQRSQLLAIVDDLTSQLRTTKATTVQTTALQKEHQAHEATKLLIDSKQKEIESLQQDIKSLNKSMQQMGQSLEHHNVEKVSLEDQNRHLNGIIQDQNNTIEDLLQRRDQLEQEVSRLKSQIELTQSSKDKIILKLKQEMRLQAQQSSILNGTPPTQLNNTSAMAGQNNNLNQNMSGTNNLINSSSAARQTHQFQSQMQMRQQNLQFTQSSQNNINLDGGRVTGSSSGPGNYRNGPPGQ